MVRNVSPERLREKRITECSNCPVRAAVCEDCKPDLGEDSDGVYGALNKCCDDDKFVCKWCNTFSRQIGCTQERVKRMRAKDTKEASTSDGGAESPKAKRHKASPSANAHAT
jgi:hypothetical protein